jgi:hypothetical protein
VTITPRCVFRVEAVQHSGLGVFQVEQAKDDLALLRFLLELGFCFMTS